MTTTRAELDAILAEAGVRRGADGAVEIAEDSLDRLARMVLAARLGFCHGFARRTLRWVGNGDARP